MIGASKILTVSYGTFSCTLEGFDEPFNTMKAIAEYFRDLAADDRYFGAEPPTPDAAMLHRIAEREVQRRVEAKIDGNGVILRAGDRAAPLAPAPQPAPAPQAAVPGLLAEESVAAKLQRIRAAVSRAAATAAPMVEDAVFVEDEHAAPVAPAMPATAFAPTQVEDEPVDDTPIAALRDQWEAIDAAEDAAEEAAFAKADDDLRDVFETPEIALAPEDPTPEAPEAFAEDLTELFAEPVDALPEDVAATTAEDLPEYAMDEAADSDLIASLTATERTEIAPPPAPEAEAEAEAEQDFTNLLATVSADPAATAADEAAAAFDGEAEIKAVVLDERADRDEAAPQALGDIEAEQEDEVFADAFEDEGFETAAVHGRYAWTDDTDDTEEFEDIPAAETPVAPQVYEAMEADEVFEDLPADIAVPPATGMADPKVPAEPESADASPAAEKLRRARARVIKVRRADAPADATGETHPLTHGDEADLQRQLAAAERESDEARKADRDGRNILESKNGDEDVTRLLRQTNTEMDVPENRRRMSTLAHLKAAVAATVAELRAPHPSTETGETSRLDRYRADLARVVRPRRPGAGDASASERPTPLVLVSEQRIDRPAADSSAPARVMPRRISAGNLALDDDEAENSDETDTSADAANIFASSKNFVEFAERLGASELPDLLEAAAAYTACVEGRPHFSRPHLMRHVATIAEDSDANREDSMRSFGQLLRQGKIEKVKRGQFAITDSSYFLAEARRMTR